MQHQLTRRAQVQAWSEKAAEKLLVLRADCTNPLCHVAVQDKSATRAGNSCSKCPAHGSSSKRSSLVAHFHTIIERVGCADAIIYDWHDVPEDPRASIDATVVCGDKWTRFEIDGCQHFENSGTSRKASDYKKDSILKRWKKGLMRLHYLQTERWQEYIVWALDEDMQRPYYSSKYKDCLDGDMFASGLLEL